MLSLQLVKFVLHVWSRSDHTHNGRNHKLREIDLKPSVLTHMVKDLLPGTSYAVSVTAVNEVGSGEPSPPLHFITGEEEPTGAPTDVRVDAKGSKTVLVQWRAPPRHDWNGNITGYYIQYRPYDISQPYIKAINAHPGIENATKPYSYLLTGLTKSKAYKISIKAFNSAGTGPASQELSVSTLGADAPSAPHFDSYSVLTKSAVKLAWSPTLSDQVPVTETKSVVLLNNRLFQVSGYTLYTKRNDLELFTNIIPVPSGQTVYSIQNLEPGVRYTFQVSAVNSYGESELSEPLNVNLMTSSLGFTLLLAESNMFLISAAMIAFVSIAAAIMVSLMYVKKYRKQAEEGTVLCFEVCS